jgi:hypothetical protein
MVEKTEEVLGRVQSAVQANTIIDELAAAGKYTVDRRSKDGFIVYDCGDGHEITIKMLGERDYVVVKRPKGGEQVAV